MNTSAGRDDGQSSVRGIDDVDCDDFIVRTVLCLSDLLSSILILIIKGNVNQSID